MERRIDYLEYRVRGERVMTCGFVRTVLRKDRVCLEVAVNGLRRELPWEMKLVSGQAEYLPVEICCCGEWHSAGYLGLSEGAGSFCLERRLQETEGDTLNQLFCWNKIRIPMDAEREICCEREREEAGTIMEKIEEKTEEKTEEAEENAEEKPESEVTAKQICGSKWEQIEQIYPYVTPFDDKRQYISIRPADFLLLSEKSYRKADNSFTHHGYCSYGYLVLTRLEKHGEFFCYLGVPGNYYSEEVAAAKYFGFDSFEGKHEVTRDGEFGFYMMKVDL